MDGRMGGLSLEERGENLTTRTWSRFLRFFGRGLSSHGELVLVSLGSARNSESECSAKDCCARH